ncbi:MAG: type II secretion system F family protein [Treponema sp.]|nr:type II secretion system F family protein [Treponema sp.]
MIKKLTDDLDELFVKQGLSLADSLEVIAGHENGRKKRLQNTAAYILSSLRHGNSLSNAMKECPYMRFGEVYISFIMLAEKSGNLIETISFLKKKCEREYSGKMKIAEASVYPLFVIFLSFAAGLLLLKYTNAAVDGTLISLFFFLIAVALAIFILCRGILKEDKLADAFFAVDFLVKSGNSISAAVGFSAYVTGVNSRIGMKMLEAKSKLEYGMGLCDALMLKGRMMEILYFAEKGASRSDVFEKLALWEEARFERKRRICLELLEPVFICIAGLFLLILIIHIFMPFMNDMSWM